MSTGTTWQTESSSSDATFGLGERFGRACRGSEVFLLSSDLGGGKTTFTKGLAAGLGSTDQVGSPTYTISRVYSGRNNMSIHHFDFYRIDEPGIVAHELAEVITDPQAVTVIEWGDAVQGVLPDRTIAITFQRLPNNDELRSIHVVCPTASAYILEGAL